MRGALAMALAAMLALAACSPLGTLNAVIPGSSYTLNADVAYGPLPRQRLDIYRPTCGTCGGLAAGRFLLRRLLEPGREGRLQVRR